MAEAAGLIACLAADIAFCTCTCRRMHTVTLHPSDSAVSALSCTSIVRLLSSRYMPCSALAEDYSPQLAPTQVRPRKEHDDVAFLATSLG